MANPVKPYSEELRRQLARWAESELYQSRLPKTDVAGKRFNKLVIQRAVGHARHGRLMVLCHCDCGNAKIMSYDSLRGNVKSCGCLNEELKPALKRQRVAGELLMRVIKSSRTANRTAKPVDGLPPMPQPMIPPNNCVDSHAPPLSPNGDSDDSEA